MSDSIIKVESVSKRFMISHESKERYTSLRDQIAKGVKGVLRPKKKSGEIEEFWALKDLDFEIKEGDRVGIIGRNGAGKSTLLKVISRITEPSSGKIEINGRVASLLEVGTGFHPELTGRENIFLNGAILGMSRAEIRKKFDEIVDFAEVEKFLDTPVKRYSSGMYVRLAFAVAAHLDPEILIVDEVLAVGDAQFQKKCLGKMEDVSKNSGRTVLFVSHNTSALLHLCNKGIVLHQGTKILQDDIGKCVSFYNKSATNHNTISAIQLSRNVTIESVATNSANIYPFTDLELSCLIRVKDVSENFKSFVFVIEKNGKRVAIIDCRDVLLDRTFSPGQFRVSTTIRRLPLVEGDYTVNLYIESSSLSGDINGVYHFQVLPYITDDSNYTPYDVSVRGDIELTFTNQLI